MKKKILFMLFIAVLLVSSCSKSIEKINNDNVVKDTNVSNNVNNIHSNSNVDNNENTQSNNETIDENITDEVISENINAEDVELDNISDLFEDF